MTPLKGKTSKPKVSELREQIISDLAMLVTEELFEIYGRPEDQRYVVDLRRLLRKALEAYDRQQKQEIGKQFVKWYLGDENELIEDAIERITGVKVGGK